MASTLLDAVKIYLDITWEDQHTNAKLTGILARAQTKICAYAGNNSIAFDEASEERQLLLDLCRYIYNNANEDFEAAYRHDLIMLRAKYATESEYDDETDDDIESPDIGGTS